MMDVPKNSFHELVSPVPSVDRSRASLGDRKHHEATDMASTGASINREGEATSSDVGLNISGEASSSDADIKRRVVWKLDLAILPLLVSIQFLSQLDKSDLGNAKLAGMEKELRISLNSYSLLSSMILIGLILFQLPGTVLIRSIGPSLQFAGAIISWGLFTTLIAVATTTSTVMGLRFLVGVAEAFAHGTLLYLTFWYTYDELAIRGAVFSGTASLAGAFNGVIAHAVSENLNHVHGWAPWRWIFFIEGIIPIGWGFIVLLLLPNTPETCKWLFTQEEKDLLIRRSRATHNTGSSKVRPRAILQVLLDPTFWMLTVINCGIHFTETSLPNFVPSIIVGIGWTGEQAQLKSSIVYVCAFVSTILWSVLSTKLKSRGMLIVINCGISLVGLILLRFLTQATARLGALCLLVIGIYPCVLLIIIWLAVTIPGYTHRSSAAAMINMASSIFGIAGNSVYNDPPLYHKGIVVSSALIVVAGVTSAILLCYLHILNKKKESEKQVIGVDEASDEDIDILGNHHPRFMYGY